MAAHRRAAASLLAASAVLLTACAAPLPPSVVAATSAVVGWSAELTSLNAAAAPTAGNLDLAAATHDGFGATVDGEFVPDTAFGEVTITSDDPFTVRYDLAEPSWSDGTPLDAADLMLAWAASAGLLGRDADAQDAEGASTDVAAEPPVVDEFARAIEVTFAEPTILWQSALSVAVPAHVVGERAFGLDDPMQAKQAVIRAVQDDDASALAKIAEVWQRAYEIGDDAAVADDLLVGSGPYVVSEIEGDADGRRITLVPNPVYAGARAPQIARIELVPPGDDPVAQIGDALDVATVPPTAANHASIHGLERRDATIEPTHDGEVWAVVLRSEGVFSTLRARAAFLRVVPPTDMVDAGAGEWSSVYTKTTSMVTAPDARAYEVVAEDSGFEETLGTPADDPALDRAAAGVTAGTRVCVLFDRDSAFASGAFAALRAAAKEAGWAVADCGAADLDEARDAGGWNAVIERVPLPRTPDELADLWGSDGAATVTDNADPDRDELIATLARTVDVYESREILAAIEATIVRAAVARPLAMDPVVTIADRDVTGVAARSGSVAPLLSGVAQWAVVPASGAIPTP